MEKYSIQALIPEITGVDENSCNWELKVKKSTG